MLHAQRNDSKCASRNEHDEPVIIENGSIKMDFNPCDKKQITGFLTEGGKYFYRGNAPMVKRIRVWLREKNGSYYEQLCDGGSGSNEKEECSAPYLDRNSFVLIQSNGKKVWFDWRGNDEEGLLMTSTEPRFEVNTAVHNPYRHRVIAKDVEVMELQFRFKNKLQPFIRPKDGAIFIKICTKLGNAHCSDTPE
ncbi:MAG: hypothetical protein JNM66_01970 [Bryobacterales bacterium]|nr:hypothetical protein [Bryobacterales bacterium]